MDREHADGESRVSAPSLESRFADLKDANQQLIVAGLREHERAASSARAVREVRRQLDRQSLLAQATAMLDTSLDVTPTLQAVARMMVPSLADWCVVDLVDDGGSARQVEVAHVNAQKEAELRALEKGLGKVATSADGGSAQVIRTGRSELHRDVSASPDFISKVFGLERQELLYALGARSHLCVPLKARERVMGALTLVSSESNRRFDEDELEFVEELARRASVAIDNARLYQEALSAIRSRDDVLAVVTHDLRSPLSSITLSAQMMLKHMEPLAEEPPDKRSVEMILRSAKHMQRMIEQLLDLAAIQSRKLSLDLAPERVVGLAADVMEMVEPMARQKQLRLRNAGIAEPTHRDLVLVCDRSRLIRVLSNLLGNAIKFTPVGGLVVLDICRVADDVRFRVSDTGPGISTLEMPRLFEAYWKGTGTGQQGTGLGLYIAEKIVRAHGGRLWAESQLGAGSQFLFTLPLRQL
jgi:signal transduction histidine kinase